MFVGTLQRQRVIVSVYTHTHTHIHIWVVSVFRVVKAKFSQQVKTDVAEVR